MDINNIVLSISPNNEEPEIYIPADLDDFVILVSSFVKESKSEIPIQDGSKIKWSIIEGEGGILSKDNNASEKLTTKTKGGYTGVSFTSNGKAGNKYRIKAELISIKNQLDYINVKNIAVTSQYINIVPGSPDKIEVINNKDFLITPNDSITIISRLTDKYGNLLKYESDEDSFSASVSYEHDYGTITIGDNDKELVDGKSKALIIGSWLPGDNLIYIRSNGIEQKVNVNVYPVNINIESNIKNDEEKETIEMNVEVIDINNNNIDDSLNVYWFSTGGDIYGHEKIIDGKAVGTLTKTKSGTVYVLLTVAATTKILKFGDNTFTDNNSYIKINDLSKKLRNVINNNISLKQSDHYNDDFISEIIWSIFSRNDKKLIIRLLNSHFTKNLNIHENSAFIDWVDILIDIFQSKTKHENTEVAKQAMLFHEFLKSYRSLVNDSYNYYFRQIIFYLLNNIVNTYISNNHDGLQMIRRYFRLFNILSEESDATTTNISKVISTPYSLDV